MRLYDALGPAWAQLGLEPLAETARERLGDVAALRGGRDALLVRPDGHLAWRGTDTAGLQAWLDNALGAPAGVLTR
jgi:4,5-epoxidase